MPASCELPDLDRVGPLPDPTGKRVHVRSKPFPLESALPNRRHPPAEKKQGSVITRVAGDVGGELIRPELGPGGRRRRLSASRVTVPETSVDKYGHIPFGQQQVWTTWQSATVKPEAVSQPMEFSSKHYLRLRVAAFDCSHIPRASGCINNVGHVMRLFREQPEDKA